MMRRAAPRRRSALCRLSASRIARILRGAVPGELPIEQFGRVNIPPTLLLRADEVTE